MMPPSGRCAASEWLGARDKASTAAARAGANGSCGPKASRATGYGIFECVFGVFWFLGSWLLGALYDWRIPAMIAVSVGAQIAAIPLYYLSSRANRSSAQPPSQNDGITRA